MITLDNPKFRQLRTNGICQLEIRRARQGDGGTYTCRAINEHGEHFVMAEVSVKGLV